MELIFLFSPRPQSLRHVFPEQDSNGGQMDLHIIRQMLNFTQHYSFCSLSNHLKVKNENKYRYFRS